MSTAIVDGGPCGPDGVGGAYRNRILTDRVAWWEAIGPHQGIARGGSLSTVAGQMNLQVAPFLALLEERDAAGATGQTGRGYAVWADTSTTASFDVASASDRKDALVIAFADTSVGTAAFGTEVNAAGGQVVVVPGVSGVTTPRTDSDIAAAVGSGGWIRVADVLVQSTDTEIQAANITETWPSTSPYASLFGTSQLIGSGTSEIPISFGGVTERSPISMGDTANDRIVIPTSGVYAVEVQVEWASDNTGSRSLFLYQNASRVRGLRLSAAPAGGDYVSIVVPSLRCAAGDTLTVTGWQNSGANLSTVSKVLSARWVRR